MKKYKDRNKIGSMFMFILLYMLYMYENYYYIYLVYDVFKGILLIRNVIIYICKLFKDFFLKY